MHVVQHHPRPATFDEGDVRYHFVATSSVGAAAARTVGRLTGREAARGELATGAIQRIVALQPDIVHFHGLVLTLNLLALQRALGRSGPPIVAHYHGGYPSSHPIWRRIQARALRPLARALFTTRDHAEPFVAAAMLAPSQVEEIVEVSSHFQMMDRTAARAQTGKVGDPVFLHTGRLHPDKDPLTTLRGFERITERWTGAQLYLYYLTDELLPACRQFVAARPVLAERVHFGGRVAPEALEAIYNSADFLLQASRREFSGYAVLESMACGVVPVVADIPSFRAMTQAGRYGILFPPGDDAALARKVLAVDREAVPMLAAAVRRHFEEALSYDAMAARLGALYASIVGG